MCGIVGICDLGGAPPADETTLRAMLGRIRHRGPDQFGIYLDDDVALGNARLSIIDLSTGQQPIANEDESLWIVFNGEVFNHPALRIELEVRGHRFTTTSDTEVVLHAYEEYGADCLSRFNGQFAIAIWDCRERTLFLARDRLGVRPLFYTKTGDALVFGSEIKALLAAPGVTPTPDPVALDQIFTFWSTLSPRTFFRGVFELPPGHFMIVGDGRTRIERYWAMDFPEDARAAQRPAREHAEELRDLLIDAARIRLRADVPVGAYLSGGLDSSTITAIVRSQTSNPLETFSIAFTDAHYDESAYQQAMAEALGTEHHVLHATHADIGAVFPEVVWHAETPLMRTAPAPMFLLSGLVRDHRFKVVLSGEGADELLAGYDLFREAKIRRFWARQPESKARPALFRRIYPWMQASAGPDYVTAFFGLGLTEVHAPDYSHSLRWRTTSRAKRFFSEETRRAAAADDTHLTPPYPQGFDRWEPLEQAQYLETTILLSQYLLSSQGDRMSMGHSVEGRFPFLDHRVVEFADRLPPSLKLNGLTEKYLLKEVSREWLPAEISDRPKQPYRAPIHGVFFNDASPDFVGDLLSSASVKGSGYFNPRAVDQLVAKLRRGLPLGETDDMALAGILSTQLVHLQFVSDPRPPSPLDDDDDVKVVLGQRSSQREHLWP
jgi:asparagine synthase (glutamine-hydrolysing)